MIDGQTDIYDMLEATSHVPISTEVETFSGQYVDTATPDPATIRLVDIAHALASTCRYGGHCRDFYSVAEHAVFCSIRVERKGFGRGLQLAALHHDDAEAYLGDIPRPLKPLLGPGYVSLTEQMDQAIIAALGLSGAEADFHDPAVKDADTWALLVEARHLLPSRGLHWFNGEQGASTWGIDRQPGRVVIPDYWTGGLSPAGAKKLYLNRHKELTSTP